MPPSKRFFSIASCALLALFVIAVLTVESHANTRGSLNARCPTCVDNNIHLAVDAQPGLTLGLHHAIEYLRGPELAPGFSRLTVSHNKYRAPPILFPPAEHVRSQ